MNFICPFSPTVVNNDLVGCVECHTQGEASHVPSFYGDSLPGGCPSALRLRAQKGACTHRLSLSSGATWLSALWPVWRRGMSALVTIY